MWRRIQRLAAFALLCGGLALALGAVWLREPFSGEMRLRMHGSEGLVVRNAIPGAVDAPILSTPSERLPFYDPDSADRLPGNRLYDAMPLPFLLRLSPANTGGSVSIGRLARLVVKEEGATRNIDSIPGTQVEVAGQTLTVGHANSWVYLQEFDEGRPVALLNLCEAVDGEPMLEEAPPTAVAASENAWIMDPEARAFRLAFFAEETSAREALPERLKWAEEARWGVEDGGVLNWFESLSVGSGVITLDGTDVTLVDYGYVPGEAPAITVSIATASGVEELRIVANTLNGDLVRFEAPACAAQALLVHALSDRRAVLGAYRYGELIDVETVELGRWWVPDTVGYAVRFEGAARRAVVVDADRSTRRVLEYTWGGEARRIVQGDEERLGEATLRYEAGSRQQSSALHGVLHVVDERGRTTGKGFHLDPHSGAVRAGGWKFAVAVAPDDPKGDFILSATHLRPVQMQIALGISLAVLGGGWLATTRNCCAKQASE